MTRNTTATKKAKRNTNPRHPNRSRSLPAVTARRSSRHTRLWAAAPSATLLIVLGAGLLAVFWLGIYPSPLLDTIEAASKAILP